ncbi:hypothetical protein [Marinobacter sp. MIT932201]|uniref:hypothetical protein n=1 Tax=Marinobacter sp. MIT932201 TaxID=3096995 RepID=UPI003999D556
MKVSMSNEKSGLTISVCAQLHHEGSEHGALIPLLAARGGYSEDEALDDLQEILQNSIHHALAQADSTLRIAIEERLLSISVDAHSSRNNSLSKSLEPGPTPFGRPQDDEDSLEEICDTSRLIYERREKLSKHFTSRELLNKGWKGLKTPEQVENALAALIRVGILSSAVEATGGRPSTKYFWIF